MIEISIVIPTYNQENYIKEAVESALGQTYKNLKVIVIDDCSTDRTPLILEKYRKFNNFYYVRNNKRLGRVNNYRNALYRYVDSEWVIFLDGDDFLSDEKVVGDIAGIIGEYYENDLVAILGSRVIFLEELNKKILATHSTKLLGLNKGCYVFSQIDKVNFGHSDTIYNTRRAKAIGFYSKNCLGSDLQSIVRLMLTGNVFLSDRIVSFWRVHGNNASVKVDYMKILREYICLKSIKSFGQNICPDMVNINIGYSKLLYQFLRRSIFYCENNNDLKYIKRLINIDKDISLWMKYKLHVMLFGAKLININSKNKNKLVFYLKKLNWILKRYMYIF